MHISQLSRIQSPGGSPNSLEYGLHKCISRLARSLSRSASLCSLDHGLQVYLQIRSITVSKCLSNVARSRPPSVSLSSLNVSFQVHIQTGSTAAPKCISEFTRSPSPSASQTRSIKYIFKERRRLYGDRGVMELGRVMRSIYSVDPRVDRHHLISISSYHTMKIHTLSFPTFGLTRSVRDFMDPHGRVVSYLFTFFLHSSSLLSTEHEERFLQSNPLHCNPDASVYPMNHSDVWPQLATTPDR